MRKNNWTTEMLFDVLDRDRKGWVSVYDIEKLVISNRRCNSATLVADIELVIAMFDRSGQSRRILLQDFIWKIGC
jgi:Ca2+-binding EF-hand superfamily protein